MKKAGTVLAGAALIALTLPGGASQADETVMQRLERLGVLPITLPSGSAMRLTRPDALSLSQTVQNTGPEVRAVDYRWQVAIQVTVGRGWRCGGILISPSYVLTAAHCMDALEADDLEDEPIPVGRNQIKLTWGDDRFGAGTVLALDPNAAVTLHPGWKKSGVRFAWDAALLKLDKPVKGAVLAPVRSVTVPTGDAVISGWGDYDRTNQPSPTLRAVKVPIVDNDTCRLRLSGEDAQQVGAFTLCAASPKDDACARDSGGPLVVGSAAAPQTIGIVSWGPRGDCGVPGASGQLVGAYTRVSEIAGWVRTQTGDTASVTDRTPGVLFAVTPRGALSRNATQGEKVG